MSRNLTSAVQAAIASGEIYPALFFQGTYKSGPAYVWTGGGTISWNGVEWIGIGTLGTISGVEEGSDVQARNITVSLGAFDSTYLSQVLGEYQNGAPAILYVGFFDGNNNLLPSPAVAWSGRMDQFTAAVGGDSALLSINCESRFIDLNTPRIRRYTNDDQQLDYPGDRGMEFTTSIGEVTVYFGTSPLSPNNL